jgi:hypothetical protein|tara:strand:+ start:137 stop:328 length:192 start_codon:yes stop_codon:yes gene_type:complete
MKKVLVVGFKIHTSLGKLVKDDIAELPDAEVETLQRVRPDALKVLGDVEPAPAPAPTKRAKSK